MVKDIAFTNLGQNGTSNRVAIAYYLDGKVSNVYVSTTDKVIVNAGGLFGSVAATAIVENAVFDASGVTGADDTATSFAPTVKSGATISNSFVLSSSCLTKVDGIGTDGVTGVMRYADSDTMIADKANNTERLAAFGSSLWDTTSGIPVFHSTNVLTINDGAKSVALELTDSEGMELTVKLNGEEIDSASLRILSGAEYVRFEAGKFYPVQVGDVTVEACVQLGDVVLSATIVISVARPTVNYATTLEYFDVTDGVSYGDKTFAELVAEYFPDESVEVWQDATKLTYEGGVLTGVTAEYNTENGYKTSVKEITLSVRGATQYLNVKVKAYDKVINEAEDLAAVYGATNVERPGYYIVQKSFDANGYVLSGSVSNTANGLSGTFDGNGQTISNLKAAYHGIFQRIGSTGMVKDIAFTNLGQNGTSNRVAIAYYLDGKVSNVYVSTTDKVIVNAGGLFGSVAATAIVENVVFDASGVTGAADTATSFAPTVKSGATISNSFVISSSYLTSGSSDNVTGVKRYADSATMIADQASNTEALTTFATALWDTTSGVPVWKTAN